jgi:hypothetical protein
MRRLERAGIRRLVRLLLIGLAIGAIVGTVLVVFVLVGVE